MTSDKSASGGSERAPGELRPTTGYDRLARTGESLAPLLWNCNRAGECESLSPHWATYTGLPEKEQLRKGWAGIVHPEDYPKLMDTWKSAVDSGRVFNCEFRIRRHDGSQRWFMARGIAQHDAHGNLVGWTGFAADIHEEVRRRDSLIRQQRKETLRAVSGVIAHHFNNILQAVLGNTHVALQYAKEGSEFKTCLADIERASTRASDLVKSILAFSGQPGLTRELLPLPLIITDTVNSLQAIVPSSCELRIRLDPACPNKLCDPAQLHRVLTNLVTNAVHAIGERPGVIEIRLESVQVSQEKATANCAAGDYACLSVSDNGSGMDLETQERVFEPFYTTRPVREATGLGLSVVEGIMRANKGTVTVESELGKGSVIRLYFPFSESDAVIDAPMRSVAVAAMSGGRLLYVDDDELVLAALSRTLGQMGYDVVGHNDPLIALQAVREAPQSVDIVLTDLCMPGMDGTELARQLRDIRPDLPVLIISGHLKPSDQIMAAELGVTALISKPATGEQIDAALQAILGPERTDAARPSS